ncbi:MCE family protein [Kibdelosporangium phytohabitans]|uniref:ABC transporter substrate-binding protein n=1 Tax=Kibdelosporangium phytohabitans TaxID=860235 RepID=A0A0N9I1U2_9PSEU|nr:MCE family protein [Kibdelosporangium phytohabitans]ALG13925.1 ABC transporter substrate-binding protein [Kibdelosporangium phytohabitans]MBE1467138.1 phospholipid/cholesterol/gamma-HCH transport system substrate-binding protein [Kibdelosporangium phytohabitans]
MLTRRTRLQIVAFFVIAVVAVVYALFRFTDIGKVFGHEGYTVKLRLADSGGIFTNAEVTYRGVQVGRVGEIHLTRDGIEVDLEITPDAPRIPADLKAVVANRSAVGEQFVDLQPRKDSSPYLSGDSVIAAEHTETPLSTDKVLRDLDDLVVSVPTESLKTVVDELDKAFTGTGPDLSQLLDSTGQFTKAARENLPQTIELLRNSGVVLDTQNAQSGNIKSFSTSLAQLNEQLKNSDGDIRKLIAVTPQAAEQVTGLLRESGSGLSVVLANLLTTANILVTRNDGLELMFVAYPGVAAGARSVAPGDGTAHLGLALNLFNPPPCVKGYEATKRRPGDDTSPIATNEKAYCAEPLGSPISVRGSQNAPFGGKVAAPSQAQIAANAGRGGQQLADQSSGLIGFLGQPIPQGPLTMLQTLGGS